MYKQKYSFSVNKDYFKRLDVIIDDFTVLAMLGRKGNEVANYEEIALELNRHKLALQEILSRKK